MFNPRGPQGQNPRTTCGPRTTVWETLPYGNERILKIARESARSHCVKNSLWKKLWNCRKTNNEINEYIMHNVAGGSIIVQPGDPRVGGT
jgi:SRSO17 transposase